MNKIEKGDLNIKKYLEDNLNFKTLRCVHSKQSIMYKMQHAEGIEMIYEVLGNGALNFTIGNETRTIPKPEELQIGLGHEPTSIELVRLASLTVQKMLDNHRDELHVACRDKFNRHANKH